MELSSRTAMLVRRHHLPQDSGVLGDRAGQLQLDKSGAGRRGVDTGSSRDLVRRRRPRTYRSQHCASGCRELRRLHSRRFEPELLEDVGRTRERHSSKAEERIRAVGQPRRDLARHGEDVPPLLECEVGRDQGAAPLPRLDDDRRNRKSGDDPVARL
jgi:hypothetical protein